MMTSCLQETCSRLESLLWCTDCSQRWLRVYRRRVPDWNLSCGVQTPVSDDFMFTGDVFQIGISPVAYRLQSVMTSCLQETCSRLESLLWRTYSSQWWLRVYRRRVPDWNLSCGVQTLVNDDFVFTGDMFQIGISPVAYRLQSVMTSCLQETCSRLESLLWRTDSSQWWLRVYRRRVPDWNLSCGVQTPVSDDFVFTGDVFQIGFSPVVYRLQLMMTSCLQETCSRLESLLWYADSSQWWLCVYRRCVPHWSLSCGMQTPVNDDFMFTGDVFQIGVSPVVYRLQSMMTLCLQETCSRLESHLWYTVYQMLQATELCVTSMSFFGVSQPFFGELSPTS